MDESELLNMVAAERRSAIGFNNDQELSEERERALEYARGVMKDVPALANRSKVTTTDINDAIETVLPDLIEMFVGGDDIATFQPKGAEDEQAAEQETDYVNHVLMDQNDGFKHLYAAFKDALLIKTGVFKWWWEDKEERETEEFSGVTAAQVEMLQADGWSITKGEAGEQPDTFNVTAEKVNDLSHFEWCAWPAEDFAVARDTVDLKGATYCAARSRPRAQDLLCDGYDPEDVAKLPSYNPIGDDSVHQARNSVNEDAEGSNATDQLRQVEIVEHYLRLKDGDKETVWRVVTGLNEQVLLEKEEVDCIPFASITPYPVAHRFYGRSVADLLTDIQRIKTALLRMFLDSGYFGLNQRFAIDTTQAHEFTMSDLLRNEPGMPVRVKGMGAITPISAGGFNFPALEAMEFASQMGEGRTGVQRNAQGMSADVLQKSATEVAQMLSAAQKRVRMIGRIFAETGVRDLFLGAHAMLRKHATKAQTVRLRGGWVDVSPSEWGMRQDMSIEIGIGSGGKQQEIIALNQGAAMLDKLIGMQGGPSGPYVTPQNLYAFLKKYFERGLGFKSAEVFITDPEKAQQPQGPQQPDPALAEQQAKMQLEQAKLQQDMQLEQQKLQAEMQLKREQMAAEMQLKREQMNLEARLKASQMAMQSPMNANISGGDIRFGGDVG
jgi:hypothetical protein